MGPLVVPAIMAGAQLAGGALGFIGAGQANESNAMEAQKNRDFQERMSNTSYQRAIADMRAAGLNPALAYQQGGASAPTGGMAHFENKLAGAQSSAAAASQSFMQGMQTRAQIAATAAQAQKTTAETRQLNLESDLKVEQLRALLRQMGTNTAYTAQRTLTEKQNTERTMYQRFREGVGYDMDKQELEQRSYMNPMTRELFERTLNARVNQALYGSELLRLGLPAARNRSAFSDTWWGRNISPALPDASSIGNLLRFIP